MVLRHRHPHVSQRPSAPHFHAVYGGREAFVSIASGNILKGHLPNAAAGLVREWTLLRQVHLSDNRQLRDPGYLARVFLEHGALTWPYGFDVAPEWLRRRMADANELACAA